MFDKFRKNVTESAAQVRALDEKLYETVAAEIDRGERRPGLWAKAIANSSGSEAKAKSLYLKYRVQSLKDELTLESSVDEALREAEAEALREAEFRATGSSSTQFILTLVILTSFFVVMYRLVF